MVSFTHYLDRSVCLSRLFCFIKKLDGNLLFPIFLTNDNGLMVLYYKITITQETLNKLYIFNKKFVFLIFDKLSLNFPHSEPIGITFNAFLRVSII